MAGYSSSTSASIVSGTSPWLKVAKSMLISDRPSVLQLATLENPSKSNENADRTSWFQVYWSETVGSFIDDDMCPHSCADNSHSSSTYSFGCSCMVLFSHTRPTHMIWNISALPCKALTVANLVAWLTNFGMISMAAFAYDCKDSLCSALFLSSPLLSTNVVISLRSVHSDGCSEDASACSFLKITYATSTSMAAKKQLHAAAASFSSLVANSVTTFFWEVEGFNISSSADWNLSRFTILSTLLRLFRTNSCVFAKWLLSRGRGAMASASTVKETEVEFKAVPLPQPSNTSSFGLLLEQILNTVSI